MAYPGVGLVLVTYAQERLYSTWVGLVNGVIKEFVKVWKLDVECAAGKLEHLGVQEGQCNLGKSRQLLCFHEDKKVVQSGYWEWMDVHM